MFFAVVAICVLDYERKPRRIFKEAIALLALDVLSYILAAWLLIGPPFANGHTLVIAWGPFPTVHADFRPLVTGFYFLLIAIIVTCIAGLGMIFVSAVLAFSGWSAGKSKTGGRKMWPTLPIMLFVLALFSVALGAFLYAITAIDYDGGEYHPYGGWGTLLIIVGIIVLCLSVAMVGAVLSVRKPKEPALLNQSSSVKYEILQYCGAKTRAMQFTVWVWG